MEKDGTSYKKAIELEFIEDGYRYIEEHYKNYKMISQNLGLKNGVYYDILNLMSPKKKKISVYFDISFFYGK